jgi:hypothetical protein
MIGDSTGIAKVTHSKMDHSSNPWYLISIENWIASDACVDSPLPLDLGNASVDGLASLVAEYQQCPPPNVPPAYEGDFDPISYSCRFDDFLLYTSFVSSSPGNWLVTSP